MTSEELIKLSSGLTEEFLTSFTRVMKGMANEDQRQLAAICLGKLLGTAYATDVQRSGANAARDLMVRIMSLATGCAKLGGADPDFSFAIIERKKDP
jgi:glycerol uptake facilitator-like aquaporin